MKRFFVTILALLILGNTSLAFAWVSACDDGSMMGHPSVDLVAPENGEHCQQDAGQASTAAQAHCEDLCLCTVLANSCSAFTLGAVAVVAEAPKAAALPDYRFFAIAVILAPLQRPPIYHS